MNGVGSKFTVNCVNTSVPKGNLVTSDRCEEVLHNPEEDGETCAIC